MKAINSASQRQKIIGYYSLAVVLPGIILGYMAYRGIRNDQALREKESRGRLETKSQLFFAGIDSSFAQYLHEKTSDSIHDRKITEDSSLLVLFTEDTSNVKKIIRHKLLYLPAEFLSPQPAPVNPATIMEQGIRLEFIERKFPQALRFYQGLISRTTDPAEKSVALVAAARLFKKMNRQDLAKDLYEEIRKDHSGFLLNGRIPLGLSAGLEILKIDQALGMKDELRKNSIQCLQLLLHPPCEYDDNQFDLFYQSFKIIIPESDPFIDSLFIELDDQKARTDYLISLINGPDPYLTNSRNPNQRQKAGLITYPFNSDEILGVYERRAESNAVQTVMLIDFPVYLKLMADHLAVNLDPGSTINIKIENSIGELIYSKVRKDGTGYLAFAFPEDLPGLKLLLWEYNPGFIPTLLNAGSGIYLFIFILIGVLMLIGLFFTIIMLNTELQLNRMKSEFISNVSHELKSPLTSIRMMTELLHQKRVPTEERKSEYYLVMLEETEHLSHLIENILDFSKMEDDRKKYNFIDLDLNELLLKFIVSNKERLPLPDFDIRYEPPKLIPVIKADKNAILQVFYNLVDNAIKFSGTSRQIDISLIPGEDELIFCVRDYGIGIALKDHGKIYERFYRAGDIQKLGIKGSGIGLTIVKKIVEAHKGHLTLESKPGEGSTFCVHLPVHKNTET